MDAEVELRVANTAPAAWRVRPFSIRLRDGTSLQVRPTEPADLPHMARNFAKLTPEDIHQRFFEYLSALPEGLARGVTRPQPRCDLALVAVPPADERSDEIYGLVQLACIDKGDEAEYAIMVRHDWQGRGLGWGLTEAALREARRRGLSHIRAYVLPDNARMLKMLHEFGFSLRIDPTDPHLIRADLDLAQPTGSPSSLR